jgi:hypothetical protein
MASTSETGHAKNVANFEDLISFCTGYGTSYNPSKNSIKIPQLTTLRTNANTVIQTVKTTKTAFDNSTNVREITFANLKKLSTRIVNAIEATDASKQTVDDAKTINRKIQGRRADNNIPPVTTTDISTPTPPPTSKSISVSQQSFDSLIDGFTKLIQVVTTEPLYTPNETDVKVVTLNTLLTGMKSSNSGVITATTAYSNARITRDTTLYATDTGLKDIAAEVKKYVKSVFGATSPQYKQISKLKFTKPR